VSKESRAIAIDAGYMRGKLKGSKDAAIAPAFPENDTINLKQIS